MPPTDPSDEEIIEAYESGALTSIASKTELNRLKAAARATAAKDRRVNIRLSEGDLQDIQVRALAEGMPYQTLIASILHKYVTGRLEEREIGAARATSRTKQTTRRTTRGDG